MSLTGVDCVDGAETISCLCLNVRLQAIIDGDGDGDRPGDNCAGDWSVSGHLPPAIPQLLVDFAAKHGFLAIRRRRPESAVSMRTVAKDWSETVIESLVEWTTIEGGWQSLSCLSCDFKVAILPVEGRSTTDHPVNFFMNSKCLNLLQITSAKLSPQYSRGFGVLISNDIEKPVTEQTIMNGQHNEDTGTRDAVQEIHKTCSDYLRKCQEEMDDRIRTFIDGEHRKFEDIRRKTKSERDELLRRLQCSGTKSGANSGMPTTGEICRGAASSQYSVDSAISLLASVDGDCPTAAIAQPTDDAHDARLPTPSVANGGAKPPSSLKKPQTRAHRMHSVPEPLEYGGDVGRRATRSGHSCEDAVFSLDEETLILEEDFKDDIHGGTDAYEADTDDSGTGDDYVSRFEAAHGRGAGGAAVRLHQTTVTQAAAKPVTTTPGAGLLVSQFGTSLPVKIPRRYWPPPEAKDSLPGSRHSTDDDDGSPNKTWGRNVHDEMRELARSIQAADDPERLFGERPRRQRYRTGEHQPPQAGHARVRRDAGSHNHNHHHTVHPVLAACHD